MALPQRLRAGETWEWTVSFPPYSSTSWILTYLFYNRNFIFEITANPQDDGSFLVSVSAAQTANYQAGEYTYLCKITDGTKVFVVESGYVEIFPNITAATDDRTHVKKVLDALEAALEGRASRTDLEYWVGDKRIKHMTHKEIYVAWKKYKYMWEREKQGDKLSEEIGQKVRVRFSKVSE